MAIGLNGLYHIILRKNTIKKNMSDYISNLGEDDVVNYIRTNDIGFELNSKGERIGYKFTPDRIYDVALIIKRQATGQIYYQRVNAPDKFTLSGSQFDELNGTWYLDAYALTSEGKKFFNKTTKKWETVTHPKPEFIGNKVHVATQKESGKVWSTSGYQDDYHVGGNPNSAIGCIPQYLHQYKLFKVMILKCKWTRIYISRIFKKSW